MILYFVQFRQVRKKRDTIPRDNRNQAEKEDRQEKYGEDFLHLIRHNAKFTTILVPSIR